MNNELAPVGGLLLVKKMIMMGRRGEASSSEWVYVVVSGVCIACLEHYVNNYYGVMTNNNKKIIEKNKKIKWRRLFQCACGIILSLSQALEWTIIHHHKKGQLCMCMILLACMACGSSMMTMMFSHTSLLSTQFFAKMGMNVLALCTLIIITITGPYYYYDHHHDTTTTTIIRTASSFFYDDYSSYVWIVMAMDYVVSDSTVLWKGICVILCGGISYYYSNTTTTTTTTTTHSLFQHQEEEGWGEEKVVWLFLGLVFPCMCLWQRHGFQEHIMKGIMTMGSGGGAGKENHVMYALACIGVLGLCSSVHARMLKTVLCLHFCLRWLGMCLKMKKRFFASSYPRNHYHYHSQPQHSSGGGAMMMRKASSARV